jgi:hypothetical protein
MTRSARGGAWEVVATTWRSYVAEVPAWAIVLGAMGVSFWTQVIQVQEYGFAWWEALIWGSSTDFGTLACLFLAREGAHRGTPTWGAWVLSIACAFMSVQFNVVAGVEHHNWLAVESHVWMPALALGVWYWTLHGRHRRWTLHSTRAAGAGGLKPPPAATIEDPGDDRAPAATAASRQMTARRSAAPALKRTGRRPASEVLALVGGARQRLAGELGREPSDEEVASRVSADGHPITASRVRFYLPRLRAEERAEPVSPEAAGEEVVAWHTR